MERNEQIIQAVYAGIDELNQTLGPEAALEKSPDTVLIGEGSKLDSLGIVTLVTAVEERVEKELHHALSLMDLIFSADRDLWTVSSLVTCIEETIGTREAAK